MENRPMTNERRGPADTMLVVALALCLGCFAPSVAGQLGQIVFWGLSELYAVNAVSTVRLESEPIEGTAVLTSSDETVIEAEWIDVGRSMQVAAVDAGVATLEVRDEEGRLIDRVEVAAAHAVALALGRWIHPASFDSIFVELSGPAGFGVIAGASVGVDIELLDAQGRHLAGDFFLTIDQAPEPVLHFQTPQYAPGGSQSRPLERTEQIARVEAADLGEADLHIAVPTVDLAIETHVSAVAVDGVSSIGWDTHVVESAEEDPEIAGAGVLFAWPRDAAGRRLLGGACRFENLDPEVMWMEHGDSDSEQPRTCHRSFRGRAAGVARVRVVELRSGLEAETDFDVALSD